jgi:hypothetical protein
VRRIAKDTSSSGLDQEREVETEVRGRTGRRMDLDEKSCQERLRRRVRDIRHDDIENRRRMVRRLGRNMLVAALNGSFAAVVGVRRRALALLTASRSLLIKPSAGEAVEGPNEQKYCYEGDGDVHVTAHLFHNSRSEGWGLLIGIRSPTPTCC